MPTRPTRRKRRARSQLFVLAAVALGVGWLGCATSNGEPGEPEAPPGPPATATTKPEPTTRPDFEAGFTEPDAATDDPTPDGGGDTCVDKNDPGSSESTAKALPDTTDGVDNKTMVTGVLNGQVDVDFYKLKVSDVSTGMLGPDLAIETAGTEMCVFVNCISAGASTVKCSSGVAATSAGGFKGCCAAGPNQIVPDWNCNGINDSAELYIRVKQTAAKCTPYSWSYVF